MFEVLVYVYENYWHGDSCPELAGLERKLNAVGFESDEIRDAMVWLNGLNVATQATHLQTVQPPTFDSGITLQSPLSTRVYSIAEQDHLGAVCLGFISFLETSGVLPPTLREIVIDRAMAVAEAEVTLDELKIIILMVYWSFGQEPDALVLDELSDGRSKRTAH